MALPIDLLLGSITFFHLCEPHREKREKKNYNRFLAQRLVSLCLSFSPNVIFYFEKSYKTKSPRELKDSMQTVMNHKVSNTVWRSYLS